MDEHVRDVIVIGAGIAGLKAASDLRQSGYSVLVLEARNRIGGRIHTVEDFAPVPVELGAELIHTEKAVTWELVRQHKLPTLPRGAVGMIIDGKWQSKAEDNEDAVLASLMHKAEQIGMPDSHESMADYLLRLGMPASQYPSAFRTIEFDSDSFSRWSAQTLMALTGDNLDSDYGLSDFHVVGGQKTMLDVLAEGLDIRLGQVAQHIDWGKHVATVEMVNGRVYQARRVVITVPPLVLQKRALVFKPDLPASKWRAIDAFQRCDIVKILLHFAAPVFPSDYGTLLDMKGILPIWWRSNEGYPHFKGDVLVGWAAGDHARHLIALGSEAIPNALNSLRAALNQPDLIPIAARMQHWNDDPFANGAYPLIPPGGEKAVSTLAAPLGGVLFWAGAATSADFTSVHGAYASGKRVALEVSASLQH